MLFTLIRKKNVFDFDRLCAVLRIRIRRIRMFLGHPDPLVRSTAPDSHPDPYMIKPK